jgi:hypothetical protein
MNSKTLLIVLVTVTFYTISYSAAIAEQKREGSTKDHSPYGPVTAVRIMVHENYDKKGESFDVNLKQEIVKFLTAMGIRETSGQDADATLEINVSAEPLGAWYGQALPGADFSDGRGGTWREWTGGRAEAKIELRIPGREVLTASLGKEDPPTTNANEARDVSSSPAWSLAKKLSCIAISGTLAQVGSSQVPSLIQALKSEDLIVHHYAFEGLRVFGDSSTSTPYLIDLLKSGNTRQKNSATALLGYLRSKTAVPLLCAIMKDANLYLRYNAATALGRIGDANAVAALIKVLESSDDGLAAAAAEALGLARDKCAVSPLIKALQHQSKWVRKSSAFALGAIGERSVVTALAQLLDDTDRDVSCEAAHAIGKITGNDFGHFREDEIYNCRQWWAVHKKEFSN